MSSGSYLFSLFYLPGADTAVDYRHQRAKSWWRVPSWPVHIFFIILFQIASADYLEPRHISSVTVVRKHLLEMSALTKGLGPTNKIVTESSIPGWIFHKQLIHSKLFLKCVQVFLLIRKLEALKHKMIAYCWFVLLNIINYHHEIHFSSKIVANCSRKEKWRVLKIQIVCYFFLHDESVTQNWLNLALFVTPSD